MAYWYITVCQVTHLTRAYPRVEVRIPGTIEEVQPFAAAIPATVEGPVSKR
jgi:hypothetical protein